MTDHPAISLHHEAYVKTLLSDESRDQLNIDMLRTALEIQLLMNRRLRKRLLDTNETLRFATEKLRSIEQTLQTLLK